MGACLDYRVFKTDDRKVIQRDWEEAIERDLRENGNSYSGGIGMLGREIKWHPVTAPTKEAAEEVLAEKHQKWGGPLAVRFDDCWIVGGWCAS